MYESYRVSAIVSTYNSEKFINGCLQDLIGQTLYHKNELEIVVIDSASPQREGDIVKRYTNEYPHIVYERTSERESLYASWNRGIKKARGKYITNANTDDRHHPAALERLAELLDDNSESMLAYSYCKVTKTPNQMWADCPADHVYRYPEYYPPLCLLHYMFGPQPLWRKKVHGRIGMFDPTLIAVGDLDFNIRFCLAGLKAIRVPEVLGLFLVTENSITSSFSHQSQEKAHIMEKWRSPENVLSLYAAAGWDISSNEAKANALRDMAIRAVSFTTPWGKKNSSDIDFAFRCITAAVHHNPKSTALLEQLKHIKSAIYNPSLGANIANKFDVKEQVTELQDLSKNYKSIYSANTKFSNGAPTISIFAGQSDHFLFAKPIAEHFQNSGYNVRMVFTKDIHKNGISHYLSTSDLAWFEWGNGHIVEASRLPKKCPMICRIHRFEVYDPKIASVNWVNVDEVIFINSKFVQEYKVLYGIDIKRNTNVHEVPNPVQFSSSFHERIPGFKIAYISRFHADKNPLMALQILAKLVQIDNRYKLYMIGGIQDIQLYHSCLDFLEKEKLQNNFFYDGVIDDVGEWLIDKSFILSTSIVESQGMAILEGMLQGVKPVIYSGFSMERTFNSLYLFTSIEEAVKMIISEIYDSSVYRHDVISRFDTKHIMSRIDTIVSKHLRDDNLALSDNSVSRLNVLKESLNNLGWGDRSSLYEKFVDDVYFFNNTFLSKISIIVISWRLHPDTIKNFQILEKQRDQNFELIFVDNDGKSGEFDELKPYVDTYVRLNTNTGAYLARNIGSVFAKAPILLFLDDDAIPADDFVKAHLDVHGQFDVHAVRGVCLPKTDNPLNSMARHYYLGEKPYPRFGDLEGNISYKAESFFRVGGWDDEIIFGHGGIDLCYRLLQFDPDMRKHVYHPGPMIHHDYLVDAQHFTEKRKKQSGSWDYLRRKHGTAIDNFLACWDKFIGVKNAILRKDSKAHSKTRSMENLAEYYLRKGKKDKAEVYSRMANSGKP